MESQTEAISNLYDQYSSRYDELVDITLYIGPQLLRQFLENNHRTIRTILDIGCANGINGRIIKQTISDCKIDGIDISKQMVKLCKETGCYENVYQHDASLGLELYLDKYDLIIAHGCLEFVKNHESLFRDTKRLLNDDGEFMLTLQKTKTATDQVFGIELTTYDSEKDVRELLNQVGFRIISLVEKVGYVSENRENVFDYFVVTVIKNS